MTKLHKTVVVGTDGSASSLRAVTRAADVAAQFGAKLVVATAYVPSRNHSAGDSYRTSGNAETYAILENARECALAAGATDVEERAIPGPPASVLMNLAEEVHADLLIVGSVGLNTLSGRVLGSVPGSVTRRAKTDVMVVHTDA